MQVCTSLQTDNHASTPPLESFYRPDALPAAQTTLSKHWRQNKTNQTPTITVSKQKRHKNASFLSQEQRLEGVVEAKVASTVDDDSHTGDDKTAVQTNEAVGFDRLDVDVNHSIELSLRTLQSCPMCTLTATRTSQPPL